MNTKAIVCAVSVLALVTSMHACANSFDRGDSESHFLVECSGDCPGDMQCVCGVCTSACSTVSACTTLNRRAVCAEEPSSGCAAGARVCDVACLTSSGCDALGYGFDCIGGRCRRLSAGDGGFLGPARSALLDPGPSLPAVDVQSACAVPDGNKVRYANRAEFEALIVGDWLGCSVPRGPWGGQGGLRFMANHTWFSLVQNEACGYEPVNTGFTGFGTWSSTDPGMGYDIVFAAVPQLGAGARASFASTGRLLLNFESETDQIFVRMPTTPAANPSCTIPDAGGATR